MVPLLTISALSSQCQSEMLQAAQLWKDVEALAEENNISTIAEHLEQPPAKKT